MDKYELKELKVLLQVMKDRRKISATDKELYYKVVEELDENESYEHIARVMIDKGFLKKLDKEMYLCHNEEGKRCYSLESYYVLTDKGLKALKRKTFFFYFYKYKWIWGTLVGIATLLGAINEMFPMF